MQVVDLCATVLFFVMLALGVGNYHSSWVLSSRLDDVESRTWRQGEEEELS